MTAPHNIRPAIRDDLQDITEIYNHYVEHTAITFDISSWRTDDRISWFKQFTRESIHQCLVATENNQVKGYACSSIFRAKPAYDTSVETTIYLHPDACGKGLGRSLYKQLLDNLDQLNIHRMYGIVTLPNSGSIKLHESLGYTQIGILSEVGYKFDRYWDTLWLERKGSISE